MDISLTSNELEKWTNLILIHKFAIEEVNTKLRILNEEFKHIHQYNPIEHLKDRVKKPKGIIEKLKRKNLEVSIDSARKHIHDIAGIRIICSFISDIYTLFQIIKKQNDIKVLQVKDYIKNPKPNGYKSLHMIIEIPIFLTNKIEYVKVEVQIRTIAMDFWASLEHKIYYKHKGSDSKLITQELKECADMVGSLDEKMADIRREIVEMDRKETVKNIRNAKISI